MAKPERKFAPKPREIKEFEEEVIQVDRVTRVVKGGRRLRFRATVVIGDKNGRIGYGIGKATEVQVAIQKAVAKAKKRLITIPIYNGTLPHIVQTKFKAAVVMMKPASEGTGIIAGGPIRKMMDLVGISNVLSKSLGTNNRLNVTKATYKALTMLRERPELETDGKKGQNKEEKGTPQVKVMSKKEATEKVHADKRKGGKAPAKKAQSSKKAE